MALGELVRREFPITRRICAVLFAPLALMIAAATVAAMASGKQVYLLFRDPAAITHMSPLVGLFSNLGALVWCAAATAALFAAAVARRWEPDGGARWFFLASAALTTILLVDDFFEGHEHVEAYLHVPQYVVYAGYVAALVAYFVFFARTIGGTHFSILLTAAAFLGLSVAADILSERFDPGDTIPWRIAVEDGLKFLGIAGWCAYHVRTAFDYVTRARVCEPNNH